MTSLNDSLSNKKSTMQNIHVYCTKCDTTIWFQIDAKEIQEKISATGLYKTGLIHTDHILICDIDSNGSVRSFQIVDLQVHPTQILISDIANTFYFLNEEEGRHIQIDIYTSNPDLQLFSQKIIAEIFEMSNKKISGTKNNFIISRYENITTLIGDRLNISVGPHLQNGISLLSDPQKGLVLDIIEAENQDLNIYETLKKYDWTAVLVPKDKKELYHHSISNFCATLSIPFHISVLTTPSLKELFDFISAVSFDLF